MYHCLSLPFARFTKNPAFWDGAFANVVAHVVPDNGSGMCTELRELGVTGTAAAERSAGTATALAVVFGGIC